jgi:hypothetical protein
MKVKTTSELGENTFTRIKQPPTKYRDGTIIAFVQEDLLDCEGIISLMLFHGYRENSGQAVAITSFPVTVTISIRDSKNC